MLHSPILTETNTYGRKAAGVSPDELMRTHAQLVRRTAWQVHSRMSTAIEIEDLIQIGMIALIEAARNFEDRGLAFAPYATTRVRGAMIDELRRDARMARAGMGRRREIAKVRERIENALMRRASDAEMADAMGLTSKEYHLAVASAQSAQQESIDNIYSDHDPFFASDDKSADLQIEAAEHQATLAACISRLAEREAMILQLYFVEELSLDEIGQILGVGCSRVCQIKKAATDKIRVMMTESLETS
jgi:RNA polymerase sigma factor FliA